MLSSELVEPYSRIVRPAQIPSCKYRETSVDVKIRNGSVELKTIQRFGPYGSRDSGVEAAEVLLEPDAFAVAFSVLGLEFSEIRREFFFRDEIRVVTGQHLREPVRFRFGQFDHVVEVVFAAGRRDKYRPPLIFSQDRSEIGPGCRIGQGVF